MRLLIIFFTLLCSAHAQDERYFRQILSGQLPADNEEVVDSPLRTFVVKGKSYLVDLNGDGIDEVLQPLKVDGLDALEIFDGSMRKLFHAKLPAAGSDANLYKLKLVHLSKTVKSLILFLDEGKTDGKRFEATARIYLLSFENNDLSTLKLSKGPHFFHEKDSQREQYFRRDYSVNVFDLDHDGTREVAVQYNHIQRIMKYKGKGEWFEY
jgi:hypothetical protein